MHGDIDYDKMITGLHARNAEANTRADTAERQLADATARVVVLEASARNSLDACGITNCDACNPLRQSLANHNPLAVAINRVLAAVFEERRLQRELFERTSKADKGPMGWIGSQEYVELRVKVGRASLNKEEAVDTLNAIAPWFHSAIIGSSTNNTTENDRL